MKTDVLTLRQLEALWLVAAGKSDFEIAEALGIGMRGVESLRTRMMARLDLHSRSALVQYAMRRHANNPAPEKESK